MDRETRDVQLEGHTFTVKTYATAREAAAIQQAYFTGAKVEVVGDQPKISEFNPNVAFEVEQELVRQMVVAMDGTADTIVDRCLELPSDVYNELITQLDQLVSKKKELEAAISHYSRGKMTPDMLMVAICQEFGWTYYEYISQPSFFIELVKHKLIRDNKEQEMKIKQAQRGRS